MATGRARTATAEMGPSPLGTAHAASASTLGIGRARERPGTSDATPAAQGEFTVIGAFVLLACVAAVNGEFSLGFTARFFGRDEKRKDVFHALCCFCFAIPDCASYSIGVLLCLSCSRRPVPYLFVYCFQPLTHTLSIRRPLRSRIGKGNDHA